MDEDAERSSLFRGASPSRRAEAGGEDEAGAAAQVDDAAAAEPAAAPGLGEEDEDDSARSALFEGASPSKAGQEGSKAAEAESEADQEPVALNLEDLDITTHDIDFETIDEDLRKFQEDEVVRVALSQNVDLRDYARALDRDLESACVESVGEYVEGAGDVARLHQQLVQCDDVLGSMQSVLAGFQSDLSGISDQIKTLQESSLSMNVQLHNRREAESRLKDFLDNVVVPPKLVSGICEGPVDASFIEHLRTLHRKLEYAQPPGSEEDAPAGDTTQPSAEECSPFTAEEAGLAGVRRAFDGTQVLDTQAARESLPQLERLRTKAAARARQFLLSEMGKLRDKRLNVGMWQQNVLLGVKKLMPFLARYAPEVAAEVRTAYADGMSRLLVAVVKAYHAGLSKLHRTLASKHDLVAVQEGAVKGVFSSKVDLSKRQDHFCLGDRVEVLRDPLAEPLQVHAVSQANLPYEQLFRSQQKHLLDTATAEYLFLKDFFGSHAHDLFHRIFTKVLSTMLEQLENYLYTCYDAVALLLMVRITSAHRATMEQRRLRMLDSYFDRVSGLLWPRFAAVVDLNVRSMIRANPRKLGVVEFHPHYAARRYAEFAASLSTLQRVLREGGAGEDSVSSALASLRDGIVHLLRALAESWHSSVRDRHIFLTNNFAQIVTVLKERGAPQEEIQFFDELLNVQVSHFVESELSNAFGDLVRFVRSSEQRLGISREEGEPGSGAGAGAGAAPAQVPTQEGAVDAGEAERVCRAFTATWREGIERVHSDVLKNFTNFKAGMDILKQVLTQLMLFHSRLSQVLAVAFSRKPAFAKELVSEHQIMVEIKKVSHSF